MTNHDNSKDTENPCFKFHIIKCIYFLDKNYFSFPAVEALIPLIRIPEWTAGLIVITSVERTQENSPGGMTPIERNENFLESIKAGFSSPPEILGVLFEYIGTPIEETTLGSRLWDVARSSIKVTIAQEISQVLFFQNTEDIEQLKHFFIAQGLDLDDISTHLIELVSSNEVTQLISSDIIKFKELIPSDIIKIGESLPDEYVGLFLGPKLSMIESKKFKKILQSYRIQKNREKNLANLTETELRLEVERLGQENEMLIKEKEIAQLSEKTENFSENNKNFTSSNNLLLENCSFKVDLIKELFDILMGLKNIFIFQNNHTDLNFQGNKTNIDFRGGETNLNTSVLISRNTLNYMQFMLPYRETKNINDLLSLYEQGLYFDKSLTFIKIILVASCNDKDFMNSIVLKIISFINLFLIEQTVEFTIENRFLQLIIKRSIQKFYLNNRPEIIMLQTSDIYNSGFLKSLWLREIIEVNHLKRLAVSNCMTFNQELIQRSNKISRLFPFYKKKSKFLTLLLKEYLSPLIINHNFNKLKLIVSKIIKSDQLKNKNGKFENFNDYLSLIAGFFILFRILHLISCYDVSTKLTSFSTDKLKSLGQIIVQEKFSLPTTLYEISKIRDFSKASSTTVDTVIEVSEGLIDILLPLEEISLEESESFISSVIERIRIRIKW